MPSIKPSSETYFTPNQPGELSLALPEHPPEKPEEFHLILKDIKEKVLPAATHWQSPSFFAYFPANSSTAGLLGEMLSGALNTVGFSWLSSPAATEMETRVLDWLAEALDLPPHFSHKASGEFPLFVDSTFIP